ncbi:MAG TPA: hypothetical protein VG754_14560 [Verrucomicrobiae bacterium]|nr:hypothetical protein [Verrucomicrobiae bacterium]
MRLKSNQQPDRSGIREPGIAHRHSAIRILFSALLLLIIGPLAPQLFAQPKTSVPPPVSNRFLFIVDTSSAMKRHQQDALKIVYDILSNAATGQMHSGDSLGLWTFNQDVYSDLPAQTWRAENHDQIIQRTLTFLQQQRYGKTSRFDKALGDMQDVIRASDVITIFLISTGHNKISGTPFDSEINALYKQTVADMKREPKPVVTVLQAKKGKLIHFTVSAPPWPVVIPEVPIPIRVAQSAPQNPPQATAPKPTAPRAPPSATNALIIRPVVHQSRPVPPSPSPNQVAPAAPPAIQNPVPPPVPQVSVPPPLPVNPQSTPAITTAPPVAPTSAPAASIPTAPPPISQATPVPPNVLPPNLAIQHAPPNFIPPPPAVDNPVRPVIPAAQAPLLSQSVPARSNTVAVVPVKSAPLPSVAPATNTVAPAESTSSTPIVTAAPGTNSVSAKALAFVTPETTTSPKTFLIAGLALLLVGIVLIIVMVRRSRAASGPSLISQTMGNGKK